LGKFQVLVNKGNKINKEILAEIDNINKIN